MKHTAWIAAISAVVAILLMTWGLWPESGAREPVRPIIALVLDKDIGVNSAVIGEGAQIAAREMKAELSVVSPSESAGVDRQIDLVQEQLEAGAAAVLLVPVQEEVVGAAARLCQKYNARLVLLDVCEAYRGNVPYVGTDHLSSGIQGAETLFRIYGPEKFLVLYSEGQVSDERLKGVKLAAVRANVEAVEGQIPIVGALPCNVRVRALLAQNSDVTAVFCLDGALTECAAQEMAAMGCDQRMTLAGFDCDQTHISCLEDGSVRFTVLREPLAVGYKGLKCAMDLLSWDEVQPIEYVDTAVVMCGDVMKPENIQLVFPLIR